MEVLRTRFGTKALKRALLVGLVAAFLSSFAGVGTFTSTSQTSTVKLSNETFTNDPDVAITFLGISKAASTQATAGNTAPGVEATSALPSVQTALTKNNYVYSFDFKEAAVTSWPSARQYKIEIYGDDGTNVNLLATLYTQQAVADAANIDGVKVKVDTGSSSTANDSYSIIVTRVQ